MKPLDQVFAQHLTRCRAAGRLRTITSLEEAELLLPRMQSREIEWRAQADVAETYCTRIFVRSTARGLPVIPDREPDTR